MTNNSRRTSQRGLKKKFRGVAMRYPYLVGATTFIFGSLLESACDYYLSSVWEIISKVVKNFFG